MPLTFLSHQAVVLPLKLAAPQRMSGTALVLGSMAPDIEYFARTYPGATISHTWPGQFTFCLPVTLILYWLVTRIIAAPLAANLPDAYPLRLREYALLRAQPSTAGHWLVVAVSALIGSSSHVLLDQLSGGWSMYDAAQYGAWFPFSIMREDWHWIAFKLATWVVLAIATLGMMRHIGREGLLRRWVAERARPALAGGGAPVTAREVQSHPGRRAPGATSFWMTILLCGLAAGALGATVRRSGFLMHQPATWVHIGLAAVSGAFVGLLLASLMWQRRVSNPTTARGLSE